VAVSKVSITPSRPAGDFSRWLVEVRAAIAGERGSAVPCDGCTACCTASQFIPIEPHEADTLAHIPRALLFPAPRRPRGHVVLGYDERGHCPMLVDGRCSIYEHRPRACRAYDCRVHAASGVRPDGGRQQAIAERVDEWEFRYPAPADHVRHAAVGDAAAYLGDHPDAFPSGTPTPSPATRAVLAIELHELFLDASATKRARPRADEVQLALRRLLGPDGQLQVGVSPGGRAASKPLSVNDTKV
jgi:Fe-S-cluster containining protein